MFPGPKTFKNVKTNTVVYKEALNGNTIVPQSCTDVYSVCADIFTFTARCCWSQDRWYNNPSPSSESDSSRHSRPPTRPPTAPDSCRVMTSVVKRVKRLRGGVWSRPYWIWKRSFQPGSALIIKTSPASLFSELKLKSCNQLHWWIHYFLLRTNPSWKLQLIS